MENENNKTEVIPHQKETHQHVAGETAGQTKQNTEPLRGNASNANDDEQEGSMKNGELGSGLQTERGNLP